MLSKTELKEQFPETCKILYPHMFPNPPSERVIEREDKKRKAAQRKKDANSIQGRQGQKAKAS